MSTRRSSESRRWTPEEDRLLSEQVSKYTRKCSEHRNVQLRAILTLFNAGTVNWVAIAQLHQGRSNKDCRNRWMKIKNNWNRGAWTNEEDKRLLDAINTYGYSWTSISVAVGNRSPDQCAKHWMSSLDPGLSHDRWTEQEDIDLMSVVHLHGRSWRRIVEQYFPHRSTLDVANRYNHNIRKLEQSNSLSLDSSESRDVVGSLNKVDYTYTHSNMCQSPANASLMVDVEPDNSGLSLVAPQMSLDPLNTFAGPELVHWDEDFSPSQFQSKHPNLNTFDPPNYWQNDLCNNAATEIDSLSYTPGASSISSPFNTEAGEDLSPTGGSESSNSRRPHRTQRTSFTMENLDPDTRNEILDFLCRRKVSIKIETS